MRPPRHHIEKSKGKRDRRVTAIAGFHCADGVVISADTEETYADNKVYTHKLFPVVRPQWKLGVAGAGLGYLIDYAKDKIIATLNKGIKNNSDFAAFLSSILDDLYRKEFKRFPVASEVDTRIQLLVSVQFADQGNTQQVWMEPALFECQSNLVTKINPMRCRVLGTGELLKELGDQFANWGLITTLAEWASMYIIHDAKRRFGGVGGRTHTFAMLKDGTHRDRMDTGILQAEVIFEASAKINQLLILSLSPSLDNDKAKDLLDAAKKWVIDARSDLKRMQRESSKAKSRSVVIESREMKKLIRRLANPVKPSASRKSEPEP